MYFESFNREIGEEREDGKGKKRGERGREKKETERGMQKEKEEEEKEVEEVGGLSPFKVTPQGSPGAGPDVPGH